MLYCDRDTMPFQKQVTVAYTGRCARCNAQPGDVMWGNSRPGGRPLWSGTATQFKTSYPFYSEDNNKQCCNCYRQLKATFTQRSTPSGGTLKTKRPRISQAEAQSMLTTDVAQLFSPSDSGPAAGTRAFAELPREKKLKRAFAARPPPISLRPTDECVVVREHLLLLLISMVTCGRFTAKKMEGSLLVPAYLSTRQPAVSDTNTDDADTDTDPAKCSGELILVRKTGMLCYLHIGE